MVRARFVGAAAAAVLLVAAAGCSSDTADVDQAASPLPTSGDPTDWEPPEDQPQRSPLPGAVTCEDVQADFERAVQEYSVYAAESLERAFNEDGEYVGESAEDKKHSAELGYVFWVMPDRHPDCFPSELVGGFAGDLARVEKCPFDLPAQEWQRCTDAP